METPLITIKQLVNEAQCYDTIRQLRWADGVICPHCDSGDTIRRGFDSPQQLCQRYQCKACGKRFDDLTGTVLSGHHQPLSVWVLCLYFMGLNLSNRQIAQELDLNKDDLQYMTEHLRAGIDKKKGQRPCPAWPNATRSTSWRATKARLKRSPKPEGSPVAAACKVRRGAARRRRKSRPSSA